MWSWLPPHWFQRITYSHITTDGWQSSSHSWEPALTNGVMVILYNLFFHKCFKTKIIYHTDYDPYKGDIIHLFNIASSLKGYNHSFNYHISVIIDCYSVVLKITSCTAGRALANAWVLEVWWDSAHTLVQNLPGLFTAVVIETVFSFNFKIIYLDLNISHSLLHCIGRMS